MLLSAICPYVCTHFYAGGYVGHRSLLHARGRAPLHIPHYCGTYYPAPWRNVTSHTHHGAVSLLLSPFHSHLHPFTYSTPHYRALISSGHSSSLSLQPCSPTPVWHSRWPGESSLRPRGTAVWKAQWSLSLPG